VSGYQVRPSLFLDDYTLAGTRNMSAALVLNDLTEAEGRQVFLRFGIESSAVRIQARQGWFPQETVTLYPGEVLSLNDQTYTQIFFQKCLMFSKTYRSFVQWLIPSHPGKPARPTAIFARRSGWG
jgi:hypothetical protein